jgi:hypothetical protein
MTLNRRPVASLWIGDRLHYINQLCLKSHLAMGHPVTLYTMGPVANVPEGVEIRPAEEIIAVDETLLALTKPAFVANVFRIKMIRKTGAIWVDCDAFCHRPFPEDLDYVFGLHGMSGALNNGVVGFPPESRIVDLLLDFFDNPPDYPGWWGKRQRRKMDEIDRSIPQAARIFEVERTAFGPQALTWCAQQAGVFDKAMSVDCLYPVPFQLNDVFFDPHSNVEGHFTDATLSVHIYTNATRPWWRKNPPLKGSYMARMCEKLGIDPAAALEE